MKNPTDPEVDKSIGKSLYSKHCKSCHGKTGLGDGTKADEVDGELGDFLRLNFKRSQMVQYFIKAISVEMICPIMKRKYQMKKMSG